MRSRQAQNMVNLGSINEIVDMAKDVLNLIGETDYSTALFEKVKSLKEVFESGDMEGTALSLADLNTFLDTALPPVSKPPFTLIRQSLSDVVNNLIENLIVNKPEDDKEQERDIFPVTAMLQEAQKHLKNKDTVKASITLRRIQKALRDEKSDLRTKAPFDKAAAERHKKGLSDSEKDKWVSIANGSYSSCVDAGGDRKICEVKAIKIANSKTGSRGKDA